MTTYNKKALPGVGYEYFDIDLSKMSNTEIKDFGKVLIEDNVIVLRNQNLDKENLIIEVADLHSSKILD